jgi:hypothetical protein
MVVYYKHIILRSRVVGALSLGLKRPGREADHLNPFNAEINMCGAMPPLPQYQNTSVSQSVKKFFTFYGSQRSITIFIRARHWILSRDSWLQFAPSHFVCLRTILVSSWHLCLDLQVQSTLLSDLESQNAVATEICFYACGKYYYLELTVRNTLTSLPRVAHMRHLQAQPLWLLSSLNTQRDIIRIVWRHYPVFFSITYHFRCRTKTVTIQTTIHSFIENTKWQRSKMA